MDNHGGRVVIDASGKRTEHRIHIGGQLEGLSKEDRDAAIAAAHGYDAKTGLRFNLLHGANGVTPAQRKQLLALPDSERNALLDAIIDEGGIEAAEAKLKNAAQPQPVQPVAADGDES